VDVNWRDDAACRGMDTDAFFPVDPRDGGAYAKSICARCPVAIECLDDALSVSHHDDWGLRAGLSRHERHQMRKARA
jgi:WhiB family redox-sensing transcriptional regulator